MWENKQTRGSRADDSFFNLLKPDLGLFKLAPRNQGRLSSTDGCFENVETPICAKLRVKVLFG